MNAQAQPTATRLQLLIDTAPAAVRELLTRYDYEGPASPEAIAAMYAIKGEVFVDDLFILLTQAEKISNQRFAGAAGPTSTAPVGQQRSALSKGLQAIGDFLRSAGLITTRGTAHGVNYDATNDPSQVAPEGPRVLGVSQPVFLLGALVVVLAVVLLLLRQYRKK